MSKISRRDFIVGSAAMAASVGLVSPDPNVEAQSPKPPLVNSVGRKGMVTSTNPLASRAGREILLAGGNAVDAAVATALALCVVQPGSNGIAGYGGAMVIYLAHEKRVVAIDYNCHAPKAARADMYSIDPARKGKLEGIPAVVDDANYLGPMAVSVPGTMAGLSLAAKKYGKLGWAKCVQPAMKLAEDGFPVYGSLRTSLSGLAKTTDPESLRAILPDGLVPEVGSRWVQADLAALLRVLASDPESLYRGEVARRIVARVRAAGGILTEEDMAEYRCEASEPLTLDYRDVRVYAPPGMTGSSCALETLAVMQVLHPSRYKQGDPRYWSAFADALTLAWRDRLAHVGDVPGIRAEILKLVSHSHASELARMIRSRKIAKGPGGADPGRETAHLCTCDAGRNMVSLTQTQGGGWGTQFGIPGLGIVIGHGMSRFDPRPGRPNSVGPWKMPLNNMTPAVLTKGGKPLAAMGLPGGRTIPAVVAALVMDVVDFGMSPAQAVSAPRIHTEGGPISFSATLPQSGCDAIKARGHQLKGPTGIGGGVSVIVVESNRVLGCAANSPDAALGD